jgi:hypothetical protein
MSKFENIVQGAAEGLLEDGALRSNLTDDEASTLTNWAIEWLESQVDKASDEAAARQVAKAEIGRLRPAMQEINRRLAGSKTPGAGGLSSLLASVAALTAPRDRKALIQNLIAQKVEAWSK